MNGATVRGGMFSWRATAIFAASARSVVHSTPTVLVGQSLEIRDFSFSRTCLGGLGAWPSEMSLASLGL
ncbi:MAG: hypothetical protein DSY37_00430 [Hyperthermus sp.]|nr:MAG: hypothetical protein DSY37_00430 [Hyperthermus sp.]